MSTLGQKIKAARLQRGWTQRELADAMAISVQAVSQWENNKTTPEIARLNFLANVLKVDIGWFLDEVNSSSDDPLPSPMKESYRDRIPVIRMQDSFAFGVFAHQRKGSVPRALFDIEPTHRGLVGQGFALIVEDDALQPKYSVGDLAIFDSGLTPEDGDVVVAYVLQPDGKIKFYIREYRANEGPEQDDYTVVLASTNKQFASIELSLDGDGPGFVIGTLTEHRRLRRPLIPPE